MEAMLQLLEMFGQGRRQASEVREIGKEKGYTRPGVRWIMEMVVEAA
jgi:hypothetical protein